MPDSLVSFIRILRSHNLPISPAETLDAVRIAALLGYEDKSQLRDGLCMALAKGEAERAQFHRCFERFFNPHKEAPALNTELLTASTAEAMPGRASGGGGGASPLLQQAAANDAGIDRLLQSPLLAALLANDRDAVNIAISDASQRAGLADIRLFTQKGLYRRRILAALGEEQLREGVARLEKGADPALEELRRYRDLLREQVGDFVDRQYLLHAEGKNQRLVDDMLKQARLANIENTYMDQVEALVRRMAKKLAARYAPRRRTAQRGQLDIRRTMHRGIAHDGLMFDLRWRRTRRERPQVFALCDVSGSVAPYAKFLLLFLYSLQDVLPRVRSFAFANRLGEVSGLFAEHPPEAAIEIARQSYGGATDYGASLQDFVNLAWEDVRSGSTVIILGDARNNYGEARLDLLQKLYRRANRVIWLNPESRNSWKSGDSEMNRYRSACHLMAECNNLRQLERVVDQLLKSMR
ncbi:VWA domain-containing protein [Haliea sp. E17]|uniref:VWA domain-containing protein n=1 Tax=Haliea sp. E17 TaxID=3401576 RepID=UPI003AAB185D